MLADTALFDLAQASGVDLRLSDHHPAFYTGTAGGILFVAQGALENGPRKLLGEDTTSRQTFKWSEINDHEFISVEAFPAPDFSAALTAESLPPPLGTGSVSLTRQFSLPR